jgi:hypothetical protein
VAPRLDDLDAARMDQLQIGDDLARQLGVISRQQVLAAGGTDADRTAVAETGLGPGASGRLRRPHRPPAGLLHELEAMPRLRRRHLLRTVLADVAAGTCSALERRYLVHVERPHGLPTARRQRRVRIGRSVAYCDVDYLGLQTVVELDGRLAHKGRTKAWSDLERDVAAVIAGDVTVRIGWVPILRPCRVAAAIGRLLIARGWNGPLRPCGPGCPVSTAAQSEDPRHPAPEILRHRGGRCRHRR